MTRKAIALINQTPEIKELCDRIDQRMIFMKKQLEDMRKKMEETAIKAREENGPEWKAIEEKLKEMGLLNDFDKRTQYITFNLERNVVEIAEYDPEGQHPLAELFKGLFQ